MNYQKKRIIIPAAVLLLTAAAVFFLPAGGMLKPEGKQPGLILNTEAAYAEGNEAAPETEVPETAEKAAPDPAAGNADTETEETEKQEQPFLVQITDDDPSIGYVLVRMPNPVGLLPLPREGEYTRTIRQVMPDGSESVNVLHITPDGFRMEDANCEGHDCVNQGEVTLENREERILWNMVICLPHQLSAELITRAEAEAMLGR